jgi:hypothetical protein
MHRLAEVWRRGGDGRSVSKTINESGHKTGGEAGIRTLDTAFGPYNGLANRRLRPLGHLTAQAKCNGNQHFGDRHFALGQATVFVNPSLKKCSGNRRVSADPVGTVLGTVDRAVKLAPIEGSEIRPLVCAETRQPGSRRVRSMRYGRPDMRGRATSSEDRPRHQVRRLRTARLNDRPIGGIY